jgi:glycosyltransferase involved in cell wall biosynthesis
MAEARTALAALGPAADPILLAYHPSFTTNPYQAMLYRAAGEHGIAAVRMPGITQLDELTAMHAGGTRTVLHVHWLTEVLRDAPDEASADRLARAFLDRLDRYREAGGRIAWTVHNILPHEARLEASEAWLAGQVAARADVIHVLATGTRAFVAPYYDLPEDRILQVPLPSYRGVYEDAVSRADARRTLGLGPDELVLASIGSIRPYKGLDELLAAWADPAVAAALGPERRLLIAGVPLPAPGIEALLARARRAPRVLVDARKLAPDELQVFLRAANVAVLPYRRGLNSAALMLALTFGLPVIVPAGGGLAEIVQPAFARTFEPGDAGSLRDVIGRARELATPEAAAAAGAAADAFDPTELSHRFAIALRARLDAAAPPTWQHGPAQSEE